MDVYRRTENGVVTYYAKLFSHGKTVRRSTGTGSKREAILRARAMQAELDDQSAPVTGSMTHVTAWSLYEGWATSRRRALGLGLRLITCRRLMGQLRKRQCGQW